MLEVTRSTPLMNASAEGLVQDIHFVVDSGAAETVIPNNTLDNIKMRCRAVQITLQKLMDASKEEFYHQT